MCIKILLYYSKFPLKSAATSQKPASRICLSVIFFLLQFILVILKFKERFSSQCNSSLNASSPFLGPLFPALIFVAQASSNLSKVKYLRMMRQQSLRVISLGTQYLFYWRLYVPHGLTQPSGMWRDIGTELLRKENSQTNTFPLGIKSLSCPHFFPRSVSRWCEITVDFAQTVGRQLVNKKAGGAFLINLEMVTDNFSNI